MIQRSGSPVISASCSARRKLSSRMIGEPVCSDTRRMASKAFAASGSSMPTKGQSRPWRWSDCSLRVVPQVVGVDPNTKAFRVFDISQRVNLVAIHGRVTRQLQLEVDKPQCPIPSDRRSKHVRTTIAHDGRVLELSCCRGHRDHPFDTARPRVARTARASPARRRTTPPGWRRCALYGHSPIPPRHRPNRFLDGAPLGDPRRTPGPRQGFLL